MSCMGFCIVVAPRIIRKEVLMFYRSIACATGLFLVLASLSVVIHSYTIPSLIGLVVGVGLVIVAAK